MFVLNLISNKRHIVSSLAIMLEYSTHSEMRFDVSTSYVANFVCPLNR